MAEDEPRRMSVEEIFRETRASMGHTWPIGTFGDTPPNVIEGEFRVVDSRLPEQVTPQQLTSGEIG